MMDGYEDIIAELTVPLDKLMKKVSKDVSNIDNEKYTEAQVDEIKAGVKQVDAQMREMPNALAKAMEAIKKKR